MPTRVLVLGLDAFDADRPGAWRAAFPNLDALAARGRVFTLGNSLTTLPSAIWPEITMGRAAHRVGQYFHPLQVHTGEARLRALAAEEIDPECDYWTVAGRAGRRVVAIDQVQTVPALDLGGVQLCDWGLHDRTYAPRSEPAGFVDEARARYGEHPITVCDEHGDSAEGFSRLRADLERAVALKTKLATNLLAREPWDLFVCTFSEAHCAGHQMWHTQDEAHPRHDRAAPAGVRQAMPAVYAALDGAVGALAAAAGPDACVLVLASHGMGPHATGPALLPELLVRLGLAAGGARSAAGLARRLLDPARLLPLSVKERLKDIARRTPLAALLAQTGVVVDPLASPRTRAVTVPLGRTGGIRINRRGREPCGSVAPGAEEQALVDLLKREIMALRHPETGAAIVERVATADELWGADHHPDVPDLIVLFHTGLGRLTSCTSPTVGTIEVASYHRHHPRTGDHTPTSRLWIAGPSVTPASAPGAGHVLDLAPTVLALLGVAPPPDLDGRALPLA